MRHEIPSPPDGGLVNALRFGGDTFRFLETIQSRYEEIVRVPFPGQPPLIAVTDPGLVHDVFARPEEFYRGPSQELLSPLAERGLVQTEGELWRRQRSTMAPAFAGPAVRAYGDVVGRQATALATEWDRALADRERADPRRTAPGRDDEGLDRDLHREMTTLTIQVAAEVILGEEIDPDRAGTVHDWMQTTANELEFGTDLLVPPMLSTGPDEAFDEAVTGLHALAEEMIDRRRATLERDGGEADGPPDMLSLLLAAQEQEQERERGAPDADLSDELVRDEVVTFLVAGHETTALGLTYAWALLADHPEERAGLREEARRVIGDDRPGHEHVADLEVAGRIYREALRLYPPAWAVFREAAEETRLGDYRVPSGAGVMLPQWSIHRDERYFDRPEQFDPDRWTRRSPESVDAYFPFASGPHACIGRGFALTGGPLVLAALARSFEPDPVDGALEDLRPTFTLRPPEGGVPARIRRAD